MANFYNYYKYTINQVLIFYIILIIQYYINIYYNKTFCQIFNNILRS